MNRLLDAEGPPFGGHIHADLVMGVPGGMAGEPSTLVTAIQKLPQGATFSATGIGRATVPVILASLASGGHLRVGMEDTLTFEPGRRVSGNDELVRRAAQIAEIALRPPLKPDAVRQILGVRDAP